MSPTKPNRGFAFTNPFQNSERASSSEEQSSADLDTTDESSSDDSNDSDDGDDDLISSDEDVVADLNNLRPAPSPRGSTTGSSVNPAALRSSQSQTTFSAAGWDFPPTKPNNVVPVIRRRSNQYARRKSSSSKAQVSKAQERKEDDISGPSGLNILSEEEDPDVVRPLPSFSNQNPRKNQRRTVSFENNNTSPQGRRGSAPESRPVAERRGSSTDKFASDAPNARSRQDSLVDPMAESTSRPSTTSSRRTSFADMPAGGIPSRKDPSLRRMLAPRRLSSYNPFDRDFAARTRRDSEIAPNDASFARRWSFSRRASSSGNMSASTLVNDAAGSGITMPARAHLRSKSTSAMNGRFSNPFSANKETIPDLDRRASAPLVRRPSQFQRMMSVVGPEPNPIPKRYRSRSVSTLNFYLSSLEDSQTTLPIFEEDVEAEKENIQEYLAGVERLQATMTRKPWQSHAFQGTYFFILVLIVYFLLIGKPLWSGVAVCYYRWLRSAGLASLGFLVFLSWAAMQCFLPLCTTFEQEVDDVEKRDSSETALIIPAYKAALVLPETIEAALKIFKADQIYIINNGNSPEPLDNTAEVCKKYGVHHAWVPIGSKIVAEFVGIALTQHFKYIMLIDDDVHLPANLPLVTDRIRGNTKCIGYTIKSTGANGIKGTIVQQCQDMEYKSSGLTRTFCGKYGSATFPHGAIILWDTKCLTELFNVHPGYTISEDWYFGHAARSCGYRIEFCSQVFVETETPPNFIINGVSDRGGFGEMTVYKQRFGRWNYFYVFRIWEDTIYVLFSWRLGWREIVTKIWVIVEVYDSIMALLRPFVLVITAIAAWRLLLILTAGTMGMYILSFALFNEIHLRKKNERVSWRILPMYMWMKFVLLWVNTQSVYFGIYDYARFFKVRHQRVIENGSALEAAYKVRLGSKLVPLDTKLGDGLAQVVDPDAIEPAPPAFGGFSASFGFGESEKKDHPVEDEIKPLDV